MYLIILSLLIYQCVAMQVFQNCVKTGKVISLTFDDSPHVNTQTFVNILNKYNIKGTFFMNGLFIYQNKAGVNTEALVKSMYTSGHTIATHTFSHPSLTGLNNFNIQREFYDNEFYIFRRLFKNRPLLFRAPYFDYDSRVSSLADSFGYIMSNPNFESTDWFTTATSSSVLNVCKAEVDKGLPIVSLLHDNIPLNQQVLEPFIQYALSKNYTFLDIKTCLGLTSTYQTDNTYDPNLLNGF